jgi:hypothetical protein
MLVPADDDVVVNRYPERGRDIDDGAGHVDAESIGDNYLIGEARRGETASPVTADMSKSDPMGCTDRRCQSHPLPPRTAPSRVGGGGPNALHRVSLSFS